MLRVLADHADWTDYTCYPSAECIAHMSGFCKWAVQRAIRRLSDQGVIECEFSRGRNRNHYRLRFNSVPDTPFTSSNSVSDTPFGLPNGVLDTHQPCVSRTPNGVSDTPEQDHLTRMNNNKAQRQRAAAQECAFDIFYEAYPRKRDRKRAREVWDRLKLDQHLRAILADLEARKGHDPKWQDGAQYIPYPKTYLGAELWRADCDDWRPKHKPEATHHPEPKPADGEPRSAVPVWAPREQPSPTSDPETARQYLGAAFASIGRRRGHPPAAAEPTKPARRKRRSGNAADE